MEGIAEIIAASFVLIIMYLWSEQEEKEKLRKKRELEIARKIALDEANKLRN